MPRAIRLHAPQAGMHVTARLQFGRKLFVKDVRDRVAECLTEAAVLNGTTVFALTVMPNHFHMVVQQGARPLGWMMQRSMQRIVWLIRKRYGGEGHVFGRRYWSCVCTSPDYLRQAIVYTHLNPWKARLCSNATDYPWSSSPWFFQPHDGEHWSRHVCPSKALLLFASDSFEPAACEANYHQFVEYAMVRYRDRIPGDRFRFDWSTDIYRPRAPLGDQHWATEYSQVPPGRRVEVERRDVRDRAVAALRVIAPDCTLDDVRRGRRCREIVKIRDALIAVLLTSGFRNCAIARLLLISPALVSDVARRIASSLLTTHM